MSLLKVIYPYLRIKKPQAELAIAFQERRHICLSKQNRVLEAADWILMRKLNQRGKLYGNPEPSLMNECNSSQEGAETTLAGTQPNNSGKRPASCDEQDDEIVQS